MYVFLIEVRFFTRNHPCLICMPLRYQLNEDAYLKLHGAFWKKLPKALVPWSSTWASFWSLLASYTFTFSFVRIKRWLLNIHAIFSRLERGEVLVIYFVDARTFGIKRGRFLVTSCQTTSNHTCLINMRVERVIIQTSKLVPMGFSRPLKLLLLLCNALSCLPMSS